MIYRFEYKKLIVLLMIGFLFVAGLLWYKEQVVNKEAPKRANFVSIH